MRFQSFCFLFWCFFVALLAWSLNYFKTHGVIVLNFLFFLKITKHNSPLQLFSGKRRGDIFLGRFSLIIFPDSNYSRTKQREERSVHFIIEANVRSFAKTFYYLLAKRMVIWRRLRWAICLQKFSESGKRCGQESGNKDESNSTYLPAHFCHPFIGSWHRFALVPTFVRKWNQ